VANRASADVSGGKLAIESGRTRLHVSLEDGTVSVASGRWAPVQRARALVELEDGRIISALHWHPEGKPARLEDAHGRGVRATLVSEAAGGLRLRLEACGYDAQPFVLLRLGIENGSHETHRVRCFAPLAAGAIAFRSQPAGWRVFRHGWQSWTPTLSLSGAQRDIDVAPPMHAPVDTSNERGAFASEDVAALLDPDAGRSIVLGFVTAHSQWTQLRVRTGRREIGAVAFADGGPLRPGETLWSERLLMDVEGATSEGLARYTDALAREMGARVPARVPTGWCSWYYYFQDVTEADVLRNLAFLREQRARLPLDCVQIDDGYQANIGDWTAVNEKFPRGMAFLAEEIKRAGFTPGLWLAPFLVGESSRLYADHPDWVIRSERGEPVPALWNWGQTDYGLDCTHPAAEAWLRDVFRTVTRDWGYEYVKIDFLYGAALAGQRYDADATRIEAYRRGLRAVRESVGDRFVLGCGALMGASAGLVDGMRIGPDVAPWWRFNRPMIRRPGRPRASGVPSMENALRNVFSRAWMHGRLWANDPDCLLVREDRTKLTLAEVQSLATAIALSGGMVLASDDMTRLSPERLAIVSMLLPPLGDAPVVPDLMDESMPALMETEVARAFESWRLLGAFNWQRRRRALRVALPRGRWHVFELWGGRYYGARQRHVDLPDVPSRGARLLALRKALPRPQLVASTFHYSMGGAEIDDVSYDGWRKTLRVRLRPVAKKAGEIIVHAPSGYRFAGAELDGAAIAPVREGRLLRFALELEQPRELRVRFR
jgi:alpha-galactosidase